MNGRQIGAAAASLEASYEFYFGKRQSMTPYQQRVNAANLAAQADSVQTKAREILKKLGDAERAVYWAIEPDENDWADILIENAHALLDLAYEYKAELKANPPPRVEEETNAQE